MGRLVATWRAWYCAISRRAADLLELRLARKINGIYYWFGAGWACEHVCMLSSKDASWPVHISSNIS